MGYHRAGFDVVGVDIHPQKRYPFEFIQADVLEVLEDTELLSSFDAIHASPPCQAYTVARNVHKREHPELVEPVRAGLRRWGGAYVIENVPGAPLLDPVILCGSMFWRDIKRHRLFETNWHLPQPACHHERWTNRYRIRRSNKNAEARVVSVFGRFTEFERLVEEHMHYESPTVQVYGSSGGKGERVGSGLKGVALWRDVMGIDWMTGKEIAEAIPPDYTEYIGAHLLRVLERPSA